MTALALAIGTLACIASYGLGILTHAVLMAIVWSRLRSHGLMCGGWFTGTG